MRITKRIFRRDVQFRVERNSWSRQMEFWILPTLEFMYLTGMGIDREGNEELCFPGFWNIRFAWIKFSLTICINDKEDEDALAENKIKSIIDYLNAKARERK